jgi:ribonuclease D
MTSTPPIPLKLPQPVIVRTQRDMLQAADRLRRELAHLPRLAVDTESNSMYAYRERVCLIQLSTAASDYIIDPITGAHPQPLGDLFADPAIEKVFHAAEYDLMCMKREFGFSFQNLFDTMMAARICGLKQHGLGALLGEFFGVVVDKSHQRDNWGTRPLPKDSLRYAQMDTHFLLPLRARFGQMLAEMSREDDAREAFQYLEQVQPPDRTFDPEGYWKIAYPHQLTRRQTAILRELYLWRDTVAQRSDVPPYRVMVDKALVAIAQAAPRTPNDLHAVSDVGSGLIRRYGGDVLACVERGLRAEPPVKRSLDAPSDPAAALRYTALRDWRRKRALERGVESDVIIPREALWALAEKSPQSLEEMLEIPGLGLWRRTTYGEEILDVLAKIRLSE